jgi:DNA-binding ferritin-like protein
MVSSPTESAEQTLLISQPFRPQELPGQDVVGVSCAVNVYFAELEHLINAKLDRNPAGMGRVSTTIRLSQLAPEEHLFARNVYVLPVAAGEFPGAVDQLLDDYDTYVEPVRQRLSHANVFEDEYLPPKVDFWSWNLRRAAYFHVHATRERRNRLFDALEETAEALRQGNTSAAVDRPPVFSSPSALQRDTAVRGAQDVLRFVRSLRNADAGTSSA